MIIKNNRYFLFLAEPLSSICPEQICIYFIIAILGLAYPVSLQVVTRLDERYNSHQIVALFNRNIAWRYFKYLLYASLKLV
jgi:hypothetical protein